jgi:hypothetical protein
MPKVKRPPDLLSWFEARLRGGLPEAQARARESDWSQDRWFGKLQLVSLTVDDDAAVFLFDTERGLRVGYRWPLYDAESDADMLADGVEDAVFLCIQNLEEDAVTTRPGEPDENGVRWFGED